MSPPIDVSRFLWSAALEFRARASRHHDGKPRLVSARLPKRSRQATRSSRRPAILSYDAIMDTFSGACVPRSRLDNHRLSPALIQDVQDAGALLFRCSHDLQRPFLVKLCFPSSFILPFHSFRWPWWLISCIFLLFLLGTLSFVKSAICD